MIHHNSGKR